MDVSIVIVSYNTKDLTKNCLKSIYEKVQELEFEVYVVDNNSSDGSCEMIEEEFHQVKLIRNTENKGFGAANNIAIKKSNAKYVFLLNTDTILLNNAVKMFFDFMENPENKLIAVCGSYLLDEKMNYQLSYGNFPTLARFVACKLRINKLFPKLYAKIFHQEERFNTGILKEVDFVVGADMFIRKNILDEVGLFDEDFFMYFEESELTYRINKKGYKSFVIPGPEIIHLDGLCRDFSKKRLTQFCKGQTLYFKKCLNPLSNIIYNLLSIKK